MNNNDFNFETTDEWDDYIQSLNICQLKEMEEKSNFLFLTNPTSNFDVDEDFFADFDNYIQQLQLSELREIEKNALLLKEINQNTIKHKAKLTGLDEKIVLLIETRKEKATLEQLMVYCNKLHIPYQKFFPEFFLK